MKVIVEADGGSRGNPGPAGYGSVVWTADRSAVLAESKQAIGHATNNVAEYRGLVAGLEEAAKLSFVGTLIASGWYTCALLMRMIADDFILDAASMGSPGIDELRWLAPVKPGDSLSMRRTIVEARPSNSRTDRGFVRFRFEVLCPVKGRFDKYVFFCRVWIA